MRKFSRLPLGSQLIIGLLLCFFCSVVMIVFCLIIDMNEIGKNNWTYLEEINEQWKMEIETVTANVDRLRYLHLIDNQIGGYFEKGSDEKTRGEKLAEETYMSSILKDIRGMNPYILRITILTANGDIYSNYVEDTSKQIEQAESYKLYSDTAYKNEMYLTDVYEGEINLIPYNLLTFSYYMYGIDSDKKLATIYVDLDFDAMKRSFSSLPQEEVINFLVNQNGVIYSSKSDENINYPGAEELREIWSSQSGKGKIEMGGTKYYIEVNQLENMDWYIVQGMDSRDFLKRGMTGVYLLAVWIVAMFGVLVFAGVRMINHVNRPLRDFSQILGQVTLHEKQRPVYVEPQENAPQEIREMIMGYNALVKRIEENIILAYQKELSQKKAELQMLQYQINPHFLYNTLNIISALAKLNGVEQISEISESLSKIFHYNVKGGQLVILQDELKNLQYYQQIQMIRFPEKFQVFFEIEDGMEKCTVLKFLLQPLLENAIEHGVIPCKRKGKIKIKGEINVDGMAEISIFDNGIGICDEYLAELNEKLETGAQMDNEKYSQGIGIINVHRRIQNYYGERYGLHLESVAGEYTCVYIRFPVERDLREGEST